MHRAPLVFRMNFDEFLESSPVDEEFPGVYVFLRFTRIAWNLLTEKGSELEKPEFKVQTPQPSVPRRDF